MIGMTADARTSARPGAIWLTDRLGAVVTIVAIARGAAALVASDSRVADGARDRVAPPSCRS